MPPITYGHLVEATAAGAWDASSKKPARRGQVSMYRGGSGVGVGVRVGGGFVFHSRATGQRIASDDSTITMSESAHATWARLHSSSHSAAPRRASELPSSSSGCSHLGFRAGVSSGSGSGFGLWASLAPRRELRESRTLGERPAPGLPRLVDSLAKRAQPLVTRALVRRVQLIRPPRH